jgi:hypothetical protein
LSIKRAANLWLFHLASDSATLTRMRRTIWIFLVVGLAACTSSQKQAWRESGESWSESGKQTVRALGQSINPDATNRKEEWKQVGRDFGEAGKDTGRAVSKSITPEASEKQTPQ